MQQIKEMKISEVHPYERNPRKNDDAVDVVANSIRDFGWKQPIVVDKDMTIIVGHTRYKAAKKLKLKTVPVLVADDLTEEQVKAYRIADNSTNGIATWDFDLLIPELEGLSYDMADFGLDLTDTTSYQDANLEIVEDEAPEVNFDEEPMTKYGEVYQLGDHRLMCGDSTKEADVTVLMDGNLADMVFTDPPWNVNYGDPEHSYNPKYKMRTILNDSMTTEDFKEFMGAAFECMKKSIRGGGDRIRCHVCAGVGQHDA